MTEKQKEEIAQFRLSIDTKTTKQLELEECIRKIYRELNSGIIGNAEKAKYLCTDIARNHGFAIGS